ncbi:MAG: hypothetical protein NWE93_04090 [Candidatus Bathyarchaeota archaeon]|nr:hypothetical protein [Candidatus Bathyarchaeota archaeon]
MPKNPTGPFWFIKEGSRFIQTSKEAFDQAIREGKSIKYNGYPNRRTEKIAEHLEEARVAFLAQPDLPTKFRSLLTNPQSVIQIQIIEANDPEFWTRESKEPKYQK